jgi:chemotaxis protein MotB
LPKKKKKCPEAEGHGGSWKVAYADFVTAMMAFFLLMWLLAMAPQEKKVQLAGYFRDFSIFEKGGSASPSSEGPSPGITVRILEDESRTTTYQGLPGQESRPTGPSDQELKEKLKKEIESKLSDVKDQIMVDTFEGGVRIQLVDSQGKSMFNLGSSQLAPEGQKILKVVAENIRALGSRVAIEGHTDALSYSSSRYTNWELSTERASAARKELEQNGLSPDCMMRVAGYAATEPLFKENPYDPRNRRISIMVFSNTRCGAPSAGPAAPAPPSGPTPSLLPPSPPVPVLPTGPLR